MHRRTLLAAAFCLPWLPAWAVGGPAPDASLLAIQGAWRGELRYRDYRSDKQLTLPSRLYVTLLGPSAIALALIYDDGPGKTVYAYEQMKFHFDHGEMHWLNGGDAAGTTPGGTALRIVLDTLSPTGRKLVLEGQEKDFLARYTLDFGAAALILQKEEVRNGQVLLRNRHTFSRP
ncbi:hypothetical protein [Chitinimonas sp.]|uniref:hypothetical protein n=1 Tax=Chitinimonas sp. TaxID=1934313 RepID=UPI002F935F7E